MYVLIRPAVSQSPPEGLQSEAKQLTVLKLHYSLGYLSKEYMKGMMILGYLKDVLPESIKPEDLLIVSKGPICPLAKITRVPFS